MLSFQQKNLYIFPIIRMLSVIFVLSMFLVICVSGGGTLRKMITLRTTKKGFGTFWYKLEPTWYRRIFWSIFDVSNLSFTPCMRQFSLYSSQSDYLYRTCSLFSTIIKNFNLIKSIGIFSCMKWIFKQIKSAILNYDVHHIKMNFLFLFSKCEL